MIDGTFDGKPSVITKGLQSFYPPKNFMDVHKRKKKYDGILSYLRYTVIKDVLSIQYAIKLQIDSKYANTYFDRNCDSFLPDIEIIGTPLSVLPFIPLK